MYKELDKVFYIDIFDGIVKEGDFKEYVKNGLWILIKEESENVYVYSKLTDEKVYDRRDRAESGLAKMRMGIKASLLQNKLSINDICMKLEQHEGKLYVEIIKEIMQGKVIA
jgi:hypothetical protein